MHVLLYTIVGLCVCVWVGVCVGVLAGMEWQWFPKYKIKMQT